MKPLINLKAFLAVLLILIVSAALLVAYFRNYTTEPTGHEHGDQGNGAAAGKKSGMAGIKPGDMAMPHDEQTQQTPVASLPQATAEQPHLQRDESRLNCLTAQRATRPKTTPSPLRLNPWSHGG